MSNERAEITTEEKNVAASHGSSGKVGIFLSLIAIIVAAGGIGYGYIEFSKITSLAQTNSTLQAQGTNTQNDIAAMQKTIEALQQSAQNTQALSAKQEQIIADWQASQKGSLNKWYVAEAQYLVKLANDHLQFTNDMSMVMTLLQRADQVLENLQDANVMEIRKSIASDIASLLQAAPSVSVTQTYLQLTGLDNQINQLPLPISPLKENAQSSSQHTEDAALPWWKQGAKHFWDGLQRIVVVRYNDSNALPLVLPEEKIFLYQNLHAQLSEAIWGLLHRNNEVYQASLTKATSWVQTYFSQNEQATKVMLEQLQEMQKITFQVPTANIVATLQLFDSYFAQAGKVEASQ